MAHDSSDAFKVDSFVDLADIPLYRFERPKSCCPAAEMPAVYQVCRTPLLKSGGRRDWAADDPRQDFPLIAIGPALTLEYGCEFQILDEPLHESKKSPQEDASQAGVRAGKAMTFMSAFRA